MTAPVKIEITLDIDKHLSTFRQVGEEDFHAEAITLEELVLAMAAGQVVAGLEREVTQELGQRVRRIRDEVIREAVRPGVESAIAEPFTQTNQYGEPVGESTTLRQLIVKAAQEALARPADLHSSARPRPSVLQKIISDEVGRAFETELRKAVDEAKAAVTKAVTDKAAMVLGQTIVAMAEVPA